MKQVSLLVPFILLSCSTIPKTSTIDFWQVYNETNRLIKEEKFDEANLYLAKLEDGARWCMEFRKDGECYKSANGDKKTEFVKQVKEAGQCPLTMKRCSEVKEDRNEINKCIKTLPAYCQHGDHWTHGKEDNEMAEKRKLLIRNLELELLTAPYVPEIKTQLAKDFSEKQNVCRTSMKWGYFRDTNSDNGKVIFKAQSTSAPVYGKYSSKKECEKERLNSDISFRRNLFRDACILRITAETQSAKVIRADFQVENSTGSDHALAKFYLSEEDCIKETQSSKNILKNCRVESVIICKNETDSIQDFEGLN